MSVQGIRIRQLSYLKDRCTVRRGTWPDVTTVASNVACRVRPSRTSSREVDVVGGEKVALPLYTIRVPHGLDVRRGDVFEVTTSDDPQFDGRWLTAVEVTADTSVATRVVTCREQQS